MSGNSLLFVYKFPIRTGTPWELRSKYPHSERNPVPSSGTCIGCFGSQRQAETEYDTVLYILLQILLRQVKLWQINEWYVK